METATRRQRLCIPQDEISAHGGGAFLLTAMALLAIAVTSCAPMTDDAAAVGEGEVRLDLSVTPGMTVQTATYSLSGPAGFVRTETLDIAASTTMGFVISRVPPGPGYTVRLSAAPRDGTTACAGESAPFEVVPGAATAMLIDVTCAQHPSPASVRMNGQAGWPVPPVNSGPLATDPVTSLMWAVSSAGGPIGWPDAGTYCSGVYERGYTDWRLPTVIELLSVVDFSITGGVFHVSPGAYAVYSSTPVARAPDQNWSVRWHEGSPIPLSDSEGSILCVRSGAAKGHSVAGRFAYMPQGRVVRDTGTQLVWQRHAPAQTLSLAEARAYCADDAVGYALGGSGWRLPNVKELWTLIDFAKPTSPAIDEAAFPRAIGDEFWTTTVYADGPYSGPVSAWAVDFSSGEGWPVPFEETHHVRCVR